MTHRDDHKKLGNKVKVSFANHPLIRYRVSSHTSQAHRTSAIGNPEANKGVSTNIIKQQSSEASPQEGS